MMDISVAGAIAPYNLLLGGKLVSLLLASPEVRAAYEERYGSMPSVIASGMKGQAVQRPPQLVLLCTTGLFAGGSSQYNRVRMPGERIAGGTGMVEYVRLNEVTSYGTFHFSQATLREMRLYSEQWHDGSDVNWIFGEGVNPKMRQIRETLGRIGIPADELLQPGSSRALYVVPLAANFRDVLVGKSNEPQYLLPESGEATDQMVGYWRDRWLEPRIRRPEVLAEVEKHTLTYPVSHGAAVELPQLQEGREPARAEQLDFDNVFVERDEGGCSDADP